MKTTSILAFAICCFLNPCFSQETSELRFGGKVPADVKRIYDRGLNYLVQSQQKNGSWDSGSGSSYRNGVTALCVMAILSCGEDPNFGRYSTPLHRAIRSLIKAQDSKTGYFRCINVGAR